MSPANGNAIAYSWDEFTQTGPTCTPSICTASASIDAEQWTLDLQGKVDTGQGVLPGGAGVRARGGLAIAHQLKQPVKSATYTINLDWTGSIDLETVQRGTPHAFRTMTAMVTANTAQGDRVGASAGVGIDDANPTSLTVTLRPGSSSDLLPAGSWVEIRLQPQAFASISPDDTQLAQGLVHERVALRVTSVLVAMKG